MLARTTASIRPRCCGSAQAVRMIRVPVYMAAMTLGDSRNLMDGDLLRILGLIAAGVVVLQHGTMILLAWCSLGGEVVSLLGTAALAKVRHALSAGMLLTPGAVVVAMLFLGFGLQSALLQKTSYPIQIAVGCPASLMITAAGVTMRELCGELKALIKAFASRRAADASSPKSSENEVEQAT